MTKSLRELLEEHGNLEDNYDHSLNPNAAILAVRDWLEQKQAYKIWLNDNEYTAAQIDLLSSLLEELKKELE